MCVKASHKHGLLKFLTVLILLTALFPSVIAYNAGESSSPIATHAHEGGFIHTHVEFIGKSDSSVTIPIHTAETDSLLSTHIFFLLPDSPVFLLTPPPEADLLFS